MMAYDHRKHAGNHGDVIKHAVLWWIIDHLMMGKKKFTYYDAYAGWPRYEHWPLSSTQIAERLAKRHGFYERDNTWRMYMREHHPHALRSLRNTYPLAYDNQKEVPTVDLAFFDPHHCSEWQWIRNQRQQHKLVWLPVMRDELLIENCDWNIHNCFWEGCGDLVGCQFLWTDGPVAEAFDAMPFFRRITCSS